MAKLGVTLDQLINGSLNAGGVPAGRRIIHKLAHSFHASDEHHSCNGNSLVNPPKYAGVVLPTLAGLANNFSFGPSPPVAALPRFIQVDDLLPRLRPGSLPERRRSCLSVATRSRLKS
jgi:hypothetical protein